MHAADQYTAPTDPDSGSERWLAAKAAWHRMPKVVMVSGHAEPLISPALAMHAASAAGHETGTDPWLHAAANVLWEGVAATRAARGRTADAVVRRGIRR